ncbi:hypothetical protein CN918_28680 [Priestia megaterium]|nr:hypothetical protein CN918_28680 [Priestia megaterium]
MRKKSLIVAGIGIIVLASLCYLAFFQKKEPIIFDGQGDNWRAEVTTKSQSLNKIRVTTTLKYIGKERKSIGDFSYDLHSSALSWGMGAFDLNAQKSFTNKETITTFKKIKRDDSFKVTVEWDGKTEIFTLTSK